MCDTQTDKQRGTLSSYIPLIRAADGLTLSQVCALSGLEPSTIQNWIKRGFVPHPDCKKYRERHLARILLIADLRDSLQIDRIGELLHYINGDTDDESDDIISEENLYDLFREITGEPECGISKPDAIGELVRRRVGLYLDDAQARAKVAQAMEIMVCAYIAACYKKAADKMLDDILM